MLEGLQDRLGSVFKKLRGHGKLTEENIQAALREVRLALLEADVHYQVARDFVASVRERSLGQEVLTSLTPAQQVIKIVNDELTELMGSAHQGLRLGGKQPRTIMLVGLQGSGKTTTSAKLANRLSGQERPFLVPADVYRPAAIDQLHTLARQINVPAFDTLPGLKPEEICKLAFNEAQSKGHSLLIIDTAGRLHVDDELMGELTRIKSILKPQEVLLVADSMTGQDAINAAEQFHDRVGLTGVVLTKMDGDARGGAALSIRATTGVPIKFIGVGEKIDALEPFHPDRLASQILGMGDVLTLIEKAQATVDQKEAAKLAKKLKKSKFDLNDFLTQLNQIKKMGSMEQLMGMIPGMGKMMRQAGEMGPDESELKRVEAIILSMTLKERENPKILNGSRRKRIAMGSGTTVADVNKLIKNFTQMQKMVKKMGRGKGSRMPDLGRLFGA